MNLIKKDTELLREGQRFGMFSDYLNIFVNAISTPSKYVSISISAPFCPKETFSYLKLGDKVSYHSKDIAFEILCKEVDKDYSSSYVVLTIFAKQNQNFNDEGFRFELKNGSNFLNE